MKQTTKNQAEQRTLSALIAERLAKIGASHIPPVARELIEGDVLAACTALVQRRVSAPYVGRAVARALAASAATPEGFKGDGTSPLTSEPICKRSAQIGIAGQHTDDANTHHDQCMTGTHDLPEGERV